MDEFAALVTEGLLPNRINHLSITVSQRHPPQNPMKLRYAPPSPHPMLPFPTTQPTATVPFTALIVPRVTVIPHSPRSHQHRPHLRHLRYHNVHQYILAIPNRINQSSHRAHLLSAPARVVVQILALQEHELGQHD
ncbi:hypothetical protein PIB30_000650 [Stylosanthes scabra]|uniref:Uncharacterized protein n=1 Tax=Stylosanthes scabra TaxID=79078 RepID=A0ABU6Y2M1_9FABA|nr:hypothetical protein [Stylosanthes scabra]